jgi:hypothetical protein
MAGMTTPDLPLTGGCLCGAVRFEVTELPTFSGYCHCKRCQRRSGTAASPQARVTGESFRIVGGADSVRSWTPDDGLTKEFCGTCGSSLWSRNADGSIRSVRLGVFDGDPGIRPSDRQWVSSAAVWEPIPDDGLVRYEGPRP